MKWIWVVLLLVIAAFATYMAVEYLTVSLGHLPTWFPGHKARLPGHHHGPRGHYRKGGAAAALIALIAYVAAAYVAFRNPQSKGQAPSPAASDASDAAGAGTVA